MKYFREAATATVATVALLAGCSDEAKGDILMQVDCGGAPAAIGKILSLNEVFAERDTLEVEISDGGESRVVHIGRTATGYIQANNLILANSDAGDTIIQLPNAKFVEGVPAPQHPEGAWYDGDEGATLICNNVSPAQLAVSGNVVSVHP